MEENEFALIHAKYAATNFVLSVVAATIISFLVTISCGLLIFLYPLLFVFWIPMIQGIIAAANGKVDEPIVIGQVAKMMFGDDFNVMPQE